MKKLKDFIYDKNDIIIAALILIVAALIIAWRLNVILEYPKQLINADGDTNIEEPADNSGTQTNEDNNGKDNADDNGSGSGNAADNTGNGGTVAGNGDGTTGETPAATQLWVDGKLSKDVEVDVTGTTASAAIQCLVDAGLFADYAEYQSACEGQGLDHEKVSAGTFTFAKDSTKAQIARKINWS